MNWTIWIYPIVAFVVLLVGAYKLDPTGKYRRVVVNLLIQIKELTPDHIDDIIDQIIEALKAERLNPESKIAKRIIAEVKKDIRNKR